MNYVILSSELIVMSILVRHAENGLMMARDLDVKLNVEFIIGIRDKDRK